MPVNWLRTIIHFPPKSQDKNKKIPQKQNLSSVSAGFLLQNLEKSAKKGTPNVPCKCSYYMTVFTKGESNKVPAETEDFWALL